MPQSLARNLIHLVFSTKNRAPLISPTIRQRLFGYLAATLNELNCSSIVVGGVADHVHLFFVLARTITLSKVVEEVKKSSSKWMKEEGEPRFYWQSGYGAFSVSTSNEQAVVDYITLQEEHHQKMSFQEEYRGFLQKHKIEWDERFVWD
jgi:putative transposase